MGKKYEVKCEKKEKKSQRGLNQENVEETQAQLHQKTLNNHDYHDQSQCQQVDEMVPEMSSLTISNSSSKHYLPNIVISLKKWILQKGLNCKLNLDMTLEKTLIHKTFLIYMIIKAKKSHHHRQFDMMVNQLIKKINSGINSQQRKMARGQRVLLRQNIIEIYLKVLGLIKKLVLEPINEVYLKKILEEQFLENIKLPECQGENGVLKNQQNKALHYKIIAQNCNLQEPVVGSKQVLENNDQFFEINKDQNETFFETKDLPNVLTIIPFGIKDQEGQFFRNKLQKGAQFINQECFSKGEMLAFMPQVKNI